MVLKDFLGTPKVRQLLSKYAAEGHGHKNMSADEFFERVGMDPVARLGASMGRKIGGAVGIRNVTKNELHSRAPLHESSVACLCALLANRIAIGEIQSADQSEETLISGQVPSSWKQFGGTINVLVSAEERASPSVAGCRVKMEIIFPGQFFAWGAGKKLSRSICNHYARAISEITRYRPS